MAVVPQFETGGSQSVRLSFPTTGIRPNGDIYPDETARLVAYGCSHRLFHVTLLVKQPQTVTIRRNGAVYKRLAFPVSCPQPAL
jgi:hypothetical protein